MNKFNLNPMYEGKFSSPLGLEYTQTPTKKVNIRFGNPQDGFVTVGGYDGPYEIQEMKFMESPYDWVAAPTIETRLVVTFDLPRAEMIDFVAETLAAMDPMERMQALRKLQNKEKNVFLAALQNLHSKAQESFYGYKL